MNQWYQEKTQYITWGKKFNNLKKLSIANKNCQIDVCGVYFLQSLNEIILQINIFVHLELFDEIMPKHIQSYDWFKIDDLDIFLSTHDDNENTNYIKNVSQSIVECIKHLKWVTIRIHTDQFDQEINIVYSTIVKKSATIGAIEIIV